MKNLLRITSLCLLLFIATGCEDENGIGESSNIVTFESGSPVEFVQVEGTKTASVSIFTGNIAGSDRSYGISVDESTTLDASAYSVPSSVTVPAGTNEGVLEYQITDSNIPLAGGTLILNISDTGDQELSFGDSANSSIAITVEYENCPPANSVTVDITFDAYPEETSWAIFLASDLVNAVASGGSYGGQSSFTQDLCLESGDYVFTISDAFGDGICCSYGNGSYTVTANGSAVATGGSFGASESTRFTLE